MIDEAGNDLSKYVDIGETEEAVRESPNHVSTEKIRTVLSSGNKSKLGSIPNAAVWRIVEEQEVTVVHVERAEPRFRGEEFGMEYILHQVSEDAWIVIHDDSESHLNYHILESKEKAVRELEKYVGKFIEWFRSEGFDEPDVSVHDEIGVEFEFNN